MNQSISNIQKWCDMTEDMLQVLEKDPQLAETAIKSGQLDALHAAIFSAVQRLAEVIEAKAVSGSLDAETLERYHQFQEKMKSIHTEL